MATLKKRYYFIGVFILIIFALLFFLSTITKNYVVKNSEKLIGRKIEIGELHFNYAKVSVQVKDFKLYEDDKTTPFVSFAELYVDFNPWYLISGEYNFSEIRLVQPKVEVIQNGDKFNFDSLMPKADSTQKKDTAENKELKFTIRNIRLVDGKLNYSDLQKNNKVEMDNLNLDLPLIAWNNKKSNMGLDFQMGEKGHVTVQAEADNSTKKYQINIATQNVDINPVTNYLTDYLDLKSLNGLLTSNLKINGDMNDLLNISLAGDGTVNNFSVTDGQSEKILSSPKIDISIKDINLKTFHFGFGKIALDQPNLLFVRGKREMNIMRFFGPYFRNDSIATSSKATLETGTPVTYKIDTIQVTNGIVAISDKTLNRPFDYELNDLNLTMANLSESAEKIPVEFSTKLNNKGELSGKTVWSMTDSMNIDVTAKIKRMDLMSFAPYTEYYIASPVTQGWLNYDLILKMTRKSLDNQNSVKIDELEFGKRTKDTTAMKVPVRLALYLMKDANDQIKFDLPVSGNPSEPKFKLGKIIWKTFANLMIKTAASPFNALAGLAGADPNSISKLPFTFGQDSLDQAQRAELTKLATILKKKPALILTFMQSTDPVKEKNELAVQLTKADYLKTIPADSIKSKQTLANLKNDDPGLLNYLRHNVPNVDSIGVQQACNKLVAPDRINTLFQEILAKRNQLVSDYMTKDEGLPAASVFVETADLKNLPEELKIPEFKIEVSIK